ncbi:peroxisomal testis-specific protein 1 isoform X1 [Bos taurus]|uniref:peroxisomal testis-specific protein 1 isoform X1 n=1 Tax=Bos taurus TaxID=9913 RepID=UPI000572AE2E|nr:peroxisomal testis-specific protein 1 [Bos taurus]
MTSRTLKPGSLEGPGGVPRIPVLPPSQSDLKQVANKFAWKIPRTEEPDHNPPSQPKEDSIGQNHHQEEIRHKLAVRLRNIGDSIEQRMVQENFQQEGRAILAHYVFVFFGGVHMLLRFLWNNHLM